MREQQRVLWPDAAFALARSLTDEPHGAIEPQAIEQRQLLRDPELEVRLMIAGRNVEQVVR